MDLNKLSKGVAALVQLVGRLRGPQGCSWDARQTDSTIKTYLLEEAYEVLDAVEKGSPPKVCMELGDLFFQILFLSHMAEERKEFDFVDVVEGITEKMVRRHPHVFGEVTPCTADEVARNWVKIKKAERGPSEDHTSCLRSVPAGLPALLRAHRLTERASKEDFDWASRDEVWQKAQNHLDHVRTAITRQDKESMGQAIGDLLFALVNLARHWGLNAENLLRDANQIFLEGFEKMERKLEQSGISIEEATPEQMKRSWEEVEKGTGPIKFEK
ncbi:MAG: nucleoside triphosphate pyrophosphohydrolase [Deltaproteobacteria bacterium]|nr:nucleoside triphosphate pyrophosphohydrolase [Deltaproteobacteria bacterium]